jgi:elongation factor Ts
MTITTEQIKKLRDATGLSLQQIRIALEEASGDETKAMELLKAKSADIAAKKSDRSLNAGTIAAYVHSGETVGAMVELMCETDFVAKNPEFKAAAKDIAMHVAAMNPADVGELLEQPFIKNPSSSIGQIVNGIVQKFGERTEIGRFARFSVS